MSNTDRISTVSQDKLPIVETFVDVKNELHNILVGDNNLHANHTQINPTIAVRRTAPSGHASFDFVDMLENASYEFSSNLGVELDVKSNNAAFKNSNVYFY